jgi:uncharacterized membrane protein
MVLSDSLFIIRTLIASIGVSIITLSALHSVYLFLKAWLGKSQVNINNIRLEFGYGIILGLEFMVGADIVESLAKPTYYDVGLLALLVLVRTFLSYFLNKELESVSPDMQKRLR